MPNSIWLTDRCKVMRPTDLVCGALAGSQNNARSIHLLEKIGFQFDRLHRQGEEELMMFVKELDNVRNDAPCGLLISSFNSQP
jgi:hypothetical protein